MNKYRVFVITDLYPPAFSPRIFSMVKTLKQNGFDVVVFTEEQKKHLLFKSYEDICPTMRYNLLGNNKIKRNARRVAELLFEYKESAMISEIRRTIKKGDLCKPDIILCFCYRKFPIKASYELSRYFKIPFIADCRDMVEQQKGFLNTGTGLATMDRLLEKLIIRQRNRYLKKAHTITTVSKWHKNKLSSYFPDKAIETIYNGYDSDLFCPSEINTDDFVIIFTGRLINKEFRDPTLILQAVKELETECPRLKLRFYTNEKSADIIKSVNKNIDCHLEIFDFVDHKTIPYLLNSSSMIALISSSEKYGGGYGMITTKIFEALAMKKPVILSSDTESEAAEIIRMSGHGIASDNKDEIKEFIRIIYQEWEIKGICRSDTNMDFVSDFAREKQNTKMIRIINKAIR